MATRPFDTSQSAEPPPAAPAGADDSLEVSTPALTLAGWRQFAAVAGPYWKGEQRMAAWTRLGLLIVLMLCETQLAVLLVERTGEITSALAARERERFWSEVIGCLIVLGFAVPVYAFY